MFPASVVGTMKLIMHEPCDTDGALDQLQKWSGDHGNFFEIFDSFEHVVHVARYL